MISRKMIITIYDYSYYLVTQQIEGISHQDSLTQPLLGGNCLNWILGHIITSRCNILAMLDVAPVWDFSRCRPYIPGSDPIKSGDEVEDLNNMVVDLEKTQELLLEAIQLLTEDKLLDISEDQTIAEQLAGYGVHEAYHAGELTLLRQTILAENDG